MQDRENSHTVQTNNLSNLLKRRFSRRAIIGGGGLVAASASYLVLSGKGTKIADFLIHFENEPWPIQEKVYKDFIENRRDVIPNLTVIPASDKPVELRDEPIAPINFGRPPGRVIETIYKPTFVGDGYGVEGNEPIDYTGRKKSPWIAIVNPLRKNQEEVKASDILFTHFSNFSLTPKQLEFLKKTAKEH